MHNELFASSVRTQGDLAGVFEFDGETAYFYLYEMHGDTGRKVLAAIPVFTGDSDLCEEDLAVKWNASERIVGLFIQQVLWAAFNSKTREEFGGHYRPYAKSSVPPKVVSCFDRKR